MDTYKLAVCEDDEMIRKELCGLCGGILDEEGVSHEITVFSSAAEVEAALYEKGEVYDLLLLDIVMPGMSGMEFAQALRQRRNRTSIIFVTGNEEYLLEGYSVQPVQFLLKPVSREILAGAIRTDLELNHRPKSMAVKIGSKTVNLTLADVEYIESLNHSITIHQGGTERSYFYSLGEIERALPAEQFCRCHNSYIVNLDWVDSISRTAVGLRGGERIPVGRTYYKRLQSSFIRYMNQ